MTDGLTQAIEELRQMELTYGQLWTAREVMQTQNADNCKSIATVLNAASEAAHTDITTYLRIVADMTQEAEAAEAELELLMNNFNPANP